MPPAPIPGNDDARLLTLHEYGILDTLSEQAYDDVTALAAFVCDTPIALISMVDKDRQWFKARVGVEADHTRRNESFCAHTLISRETLVVEDSLLDTRFADNLLVLGDPRIRFYAGAPLVAPDGHVLGTVCVIDTKPRVLSAGQIGALEALSRQVMSMLESRMLASENRKATKALIQSEKLAAVGRLASSMAHEINNPLEAITNLLYLTRLKADDPEMREWLNLADQELRRISVIASQTLRFHKQSSRPRVISCQDLFSTTLSIYESRLTNANISIEKRKRAAQPVECFEGDVRQVLSNIVTNAIDAMPRGGRLLLRSREATEWKTGRKGLVLTLADTGTGMEEEAQRRRFEAFFTTKGIGGSGLGLWISADIMQRHQGSITIRSSQRTGSKGTVVALFLPFKAS
jgi:two-component system NtrC family sensor kinase